MTKCLKCFLALDHLDFNKSSHYGMHEECFISWFDVPKKTYFTNFMRRDTKTGEQNTSFFHGRFKKYSAELDGVPYIVKMRDMDEAPELPEVEYLCNQIGELLQVPIAAFYLVELGGEKVFVTKNFIYPAKELQHISHFRPDDKHCCETLIEVIKQKTERPYEVDVFIKTILFDSLIGNHDRHGNNLGFIVTAAGFSLSPIYDNVSYLALESDTMLGADFNPGGKVSTILKSNHDATMKDYVGELKRLGYEEQVMAFYRKIKLSTIQNLIQSSLCSELMKNAITILIKKRYQELKDAIKN